MRKVFLRTILTLQYFCNTGIMIFMDVWLNFCVRETRKLENVMKTPVIHHLQSSLGGLSIIRTFRREDAFRIR